MATIQKCPIYVLHGDDAFLIDSYRREIVSALIGDADPQVCVGAYDGDVPLADVLDELRTLPFLAPARVVIVTNADDFVRTHREGLEKYLDAPAASGTLILQVHSWDSRTRLSKKVAEIGRVKDCAPPQRGKLGPWLNKAAEKRGKKIAPDAAELLADCCDGSLAMLNMELDKLSAYVGQRDAIAAADVAAVVTSSAGAEAFALTNAVTAGRMNDALKALDGALATRGDEFKTLGMLAWHLRKALKAQQQLQSGVPADRALPRMPYQQRNAFAAMLKRRSLGQLQHDFRRLIAADLAMKSGTEPGAAMQQLVVAMRS